MSTKTDDMKKIKEEILELKSSPLFAYRKENGYFPVIGEGSHDAEIMFIGEAPGKNEALTGRPFCGAAGKILDELLAHIGVDRKTVYVTNIVKDRPPENRDPNPEEIELYSPYLDRQIDILKPKVIATLGRYSMEYIMWRYNLEDKIDTIGKIHGRFFEGSTEESEFKLIPLYHPAAAIYNRELKETLLEDFEKLKRFI